MRYVAMAQYRTEFTEPIVLAPGEVFRIVQELDADYPGWFLCVTDDGSQAWVPARIIERDRDDRERGTVTEAYTNRELDVDPGDTVDGERELLGWLWATNTNRQGWLGSPRQRPPARAGLTGALQRRSLYWSDLSFVARASALAPLLRQKLEGPKATI